jgi:hypothetical protein
MRAVGRTPNLEPADLDALRQEVHQATLALHSVTREQMKKRIIEKARESLLRRELDPCHAEEMSHTTINGYLDKLGLKTVKQPSKQNQRRYEVTKK